MKVWHNVIFLSVPILDWHSQVPLWNAWKKANIQNNGFSFSALHQRSVALRPARKVRRLGGPCLTARRSTGLGTNPKAHLGPHKDSLAGVAHLNAWRNQGPAQGLGRVHWRLRGIGNPPEGLSGPGGTRPKTRWLAGLGGGDVGCEEQRPPIGWWIS